MHKSKGQNVKGVFKLVRKARRVRLFAEPEKFDRARKTITQIKNTIRRRAFRDLVKSHEKKRQIEEVSRRTGLKAKDIIAEMWRMVAFTKIPAHLAVSPANAVNRIKRRGGKKFRTTGISELSEKAAKGDTIALKKLVRFKLQQLREYSLRKNSDFKLVVLAYKKRVTKSRGSPAKNAIVTDLHNYIRQIEKGVKNGE